MTMETLMKMLEELKESGLKPKKLKPILAAAKAWVKHPNKPKREELVAAVLDAQRWIAAEYACPGRYRSVKGDIVIIRDDPSSRWGSSPGGHRVPYMRPGRPDHPDPRKQFNVYGWLPLDYRLRRATKKTKRKKMRKVSNGD